MAISAPEPRPFPELQAFVGEKPFCDVVMKGGVTSGVVYPLAVVELATQYRLKNIGGASAGAIAAAVAAAAEYDRAGGGYLRLGQVVDDLRTRLPSLFQATPPTRPVLNLLLASLGERSWILKLPRMFLALAKGYWLVTLGAIGLGLLAGGFVAWQISLGWALCVGFLISLLAIGPALAIRLYYALVKQLPRQNYGLCPGLRQAGHRAPALTEWLADTLEFVAGRLVPGQPPPTRPLTFGDLHGPSPSDRAINLEIMTTHLTEGRPYRLPFDQDRFFFREDEFRRLFPAAVVDWMMEKAEVYEKDRAFHYLPKARDFPVIVAVRMSLSFPLLLAAVPLYACDSTLLDEAAHDRPQRCWFSDGGICSNFPIHFFDHVWPRWPTFGITLERFDPARHGDAVALPKQTDEDVPYSFRAIDSTRGFLASIFDTMQEWRDTLQSTLAGYRERIVHVRLKSDEGGFNLNMPSELVQLLSAHGQQAGRMIREAFNWDVHRWKRYLVWIAELEEVLERMEDAYTQAPPLDRNLRDFLEEYGPAPVNYEQSPAWRAAARQDIDDLLACLAQWRQRVALGKGNIPQPDVDVRITPKV